MSGILGRGLAVTAAAVVALLLLNAALAYRNTRQLDEDARWVAHTHEVLDALSDLGATLRQAEEAQRTFLFTDDPRQLEALDGLGPKTAAEIDRVRRLTEDNPHQQDRVPRLRQAVADRLAHLHTVIGVRRERGPDAARQFVRGDDESAAKEALGSVLAEMEGEERALLRDRQGATERAYLVAVLTGLATAALGLGAVVTFAALVRRTMAARLKAAAVIQRERERFRVTLASIGDAVIVTDGKGRVSFLNPVAERLTGWNEDALGRDLPEVFRIVNEKTGAAVESPVAKVIREGTVVGLANHTLLIARDGTRRPIDDSGAPIRDDRGEIAGVVLVFRDVTARRQAEEALKEADRKKDEFLAMLAHELRNPLAPMRNALQIMRIASTDEQAVATARDMMERQLRQVVRLVDDLLDVSRITRGRLVLQKERLDLADALQDALETCRPQVEAARQDLTVALPAQPVALDADRTRLAQVFINILSNAAKYTPPGGCIRLSAERQGGAAVVTIQDTGVGIPADMLHSIFDMFTQVDRSLERSQGGLGVGLTLVKRLVEMHGGSVEARSEGAGRGSEFVVRLPVDGTAAEGTGPAVPGGEGGAPTRRRILVADDNEDAAESLAAMLRLMGHEVQTAHDGTQAVQAAPTFRPDLILLDIGMPKMNGYEAARRIREGPAGRDVALVALTGWGQEEDKRRAREAGFDHHLTKPVDLQTLQQVLAAKT